jgi:SOS response regulatory protein OraA/RecX
MSDTNTKILKLVQELKAENKLILEALGIKQFIRPSEDEAKAKAKATAKAKVEAEPPTLKERYNKCVASLKRRGLKHKFYHELVAYTKGKTLQGDDYKQEYVDCYNVTGYGVL